MQRIWKATVSLNDGDGVDDDDADRTGHKVDLNWVVFKQLERRKRGKLKWVVWPQEKSGGDEV